MQYKLSLNQILTYSKCPRKLSYELLAKYKTPERDENDYRSIMKRLIKQAFSNKTYNGYVPVWNTMKDRITKACFEHIDINDKVAFADAMKKSKKIFELMHYWYYKYFIDETRGALSNVTLEVVIDQITVSHTVDLLILDPQYEAIPVIFDDYGWKRESLHNNLYTKLIYWLIAKQLDFKPKLLEYWIVKEKSVQREQLFNKFNIDILDKYVNFIVRGIEFKVFYPSVSEQCSTCMFKDICTL